jgi:hypothetical protein
MVWRADAQAFALYAYPTQGDASQASLRLAVWTMERGWQQWPELMPEDRKPWALGLPPDRRASRKRQRFAAELAQ